jgi:hypothetical protein
VELGFAGHELSLAPLDVRDLCQSIPRNRIAFPKIALELLESRSEVARPGRELQLALIQLARTRDELFLIAAAVGGELGLTFVEHLLTRVDLNPSLCRFTLGLGERRFTFGERLLE